MQPTFKKQGNPIVNDINIINDMNAINYHHLIVLSQQQNIEIWMKLIHSIIILLLTIMKHYQQQKPVHQIY